MNASHEKTANAQAINRRTLVKGAAASSAGLVIAFHLPAGLGKRSDTAFAAAADSTAINTWLRIAPDGLITIYVARAEMGQGIYTAMPMLIAEELEADWSKIRVEPSPSAAPFNYTGSPVEVTGGSASVSSLWDVLSRIGATARTLLIAAAANDWGVSASECRAERSMVLHTKSDKKAAFGDLAAKAAAISLDTVPKDLPLKKSVDYKIVGQEIKRLDTPAKVVGAPLFGIDVDLADMVHAAVRTSPVFGGDIANFAALQAKTPKGVTLVKIPGGVAAVAAGHWAAQQAVDALKISWTKGKTEGQSDASIEKKLRAALKKKKNPVAFASGDATKAMKGATRKVDAEYTTPYLAHTPMEPLNCTALVKDGGAELWVGTQSHTLTKIMASKHLGVPLDKIIVHTTYLGGGFGRRAESDMVIQALEVAKATGKPAKVIWSREEDIQHDFYRPASVIQFSAGLGSDGSPVAFKAAISSSSILERWAIFGGVKDGIDFTSVEGIRDIKYACDHQRIECALSDIGVPVGFWRSVGSSHNGFFLESFVDEMAHAAKQDPYTYRRVLLAKHPRFVAVLDSVASLSGWEKPRAQGRFQGIAVHESFGTVVAQVAEISIEAGRVKVHKVWVSVDCGRHVNPDTVTAQMESGVVYGLSAALRGQITIEKGRVKESNFHDYSMLRPDEMPEIIVQIMKNNEAPSGVGEPGTPPIAPAVANAIFAATGKRLRSLPLSKHGFA